jgi:SAM-dependent methyltransferase
MKIHYDLRHVDEYVEQQGNVRLEDLECQFENTIKRINKFKRINVDTKILEVGTGSGWFPILCKKNGIFCEGLEICPQFIEYAKTLGGKYGIEPNIKLGNIEEADIGISKYDIVIALSTFEHVQYWQKGVENIFNALKPEGLFYFYSTNKFAPFSAEYDFPFYGWLPDQWRYRMRISRKGEDIIKLGIDFHQFNYFQLKRFFKKVGFSNIYDQFEVLDSDNLIRPKFWKTMVLEMVKGFKPMRLIGLIFAPGTLFMCTK